MNFLVTGVAGFIGFHVAARLLQQGHRVLGIDNLNAYYNPRLKTDRLSALHAGCSADSGRFRFVRADIARRQELDCLFERSRFDVVIHLAAQAGVRYSIDNPHVYAESNLTGFLNVIEAVRHARIAHLVYASSSSVYGGSTKLPFSVSDRTDQPVSLYAATKRANELIAHCYSHLYEFGVTGLRFFTVYGPWGRPDMAPFKFARAILRGEPVEIYNYGNMQRDFTYIDDIAEATVRIATLPARAQRIFNVGNSEPIGLLKFVEVLEKSLGRDAIKRFLPLQAGDVVSTHADVYDFWNATGFRPATTLDEGIAKFARWYMEYFEKESHESGPHAPRAAVLQAS